jgi:hypothetical protein
VLTLDKILPLNPFLADFNDITKYVDSLDQKNRHKLLLACDGIFSDVNLRKNEDARVGAAKVMAALVPDSVNTIKRWINTTSGKYIYEVHFSLFCFLDEIPYLNGGKEFAREIPSLIEKYLYNIKTDTSLAAFMAGDLLGDHWNITSALPVLKRLARRARYVSGRTWALYGLSEMLERLPDSSPNRGIIISLFKEVKNNDRSENIRRSTKIDLEKILKRNNRKDQ